MTVVGRLLGPDDEPQESGALVAVNYGDYRTQEVWVRSGANIGNWYPLGGEFWLVWEKKYMPPGVIKSQPEWSDVLARGPVTLLLAAADQAYVQGWRTGRRDLWQAMEVVAEDDPAESE